MLSEPQIREFARDLESFCVERKASCKTKETKAKIEEAICAFSNDLPGSGETGIILIGVDDRTGRPVPEFTVDDKLLVSLTNIRSDGNIQPFPTMAVYKTELDGQPIVVVEVQPSRDPPVRLRGRVYVRVGPRNGIATREHERILSERRRSWDGPFDQRPVLGASLEDLDLTYFSREFLPNAVAAETLAENGRTIPEQLAALHLAAPDGTPNVTGLLILGRNPTTYIPGAYVQFLRIDGTELTDPIIDRKEIRGPLPQILLRMDDLTDAHLRVATTVTGRSVELRVAPYPVAAMQQLLRNAAIHRNYESSYAPIQWYWFADRIEIHNPGGLFGRATPETFGKPGGNDYRNPNVAHALYNLGFVQRFGMGIPLARKACADNGNPEPEFLHTEASTFGVIIRARD